MNIPTDWTDRMWKDTHIGLQIELEYQVEGHNSGRLYSRRGKLFRTATGQVFFQPEDWMNRPNNSPTAGFSWAAAQSQAPCKPSAHVNRWRVQPNTISVPADASVTNTPPAPTKENPVFNVITARTIDGYVGQIIDASTNTIVWESDPFTDLKATKDEPAKSGIEQATEAAENKRIEVVKGLFS